MLAIIDYGMGNLRSVANAFRRLGREPQIFSDAQGLENARAIVLPGVGAFGDTMQNLRGKGFVEVLQQQVLEGGKPFLGICIGMEVLLSKSFEHGIHEGLGYIPGDVTRFPQETPAGRLRVPHVGWNTVNFTRSNPLVDGLGEKQDFYFVHSYYCAPSNDEVVVGSCDYGIPFAAIVSKDNISAVQFHPEKSHTAGIGLLRNWTERIAGC
jgi:imidazole glycerol-phosphate synthase subunit HisH